MRLTRYQGEKYLYKYVNVDRDTLSGYIQILNKLGQLEDIEDELGVDLITLFKAMNEQQCIYYVGGNHIIEFECFCNEYFYHYKNIDFQHKSLNIFTDVCHLEKRLYFKDYGKTWALTKEELL